MQAQLHRIRGELLLLQYNSILRTSQTRFPSTSSGRRLTGSTSFRLASNGGQAESCFQRAIEVARKQSARSFELRATKSLAQLLAKQGRRDEALKDLASLQLVH